MCLTSLHSMVTHLTVTSARLNRHIICRFTKDITDQVVRLVGKTRKVAGHTLLCFLVS